MKTTILGLLISMPLLVAMAADSPSVKTDLKSALLATPWTWVLPDGNKTTIRFFPDGVARSSRPFAARYTITGLRTVSLEMLSKEFRDMKGKAVLTFSDDFKSYRGIHFDQARVITGIPDAATTDPSASPAK